MEDSILTSIKLSLGLTEEMTAFDPQLILHINSVFMILNQLGVGPEKPFMITDADSTWSEFIPDGEMESVKTYMSLQVKNLFDPPSNSFVLDANKRMIEELEWRMNVKASES